MDIGWRFPTLILSFSLGLVSCKQEAAVEEILRPVRYQEMFAAGGSRMRSFSGVAQAAVESRLSFKVSGTLKQLWVKVGDVVSVGTPIAEIDDSDYQLRVQQAQASLESARAQARNAEANYDRVRQLYENRNASRNDLDSARAASESAKAQVRASEKQLELGTAQLSYTRLRAPSKGAIASVDVEPNENLQPGQTVVQLSSGSKLEVRVAVPEILIARIRQGQPVEVRFDALPDQRFSGRITEVGVSPTSLATTYPVTVLLDATSADTRPGMAVEVLISLGAEEGRDRFLVPSFAVREDRGGRHVFTVQPSDEEGVGIIQRKTVTTGALTEEGIEVFDGLKDGDRVVTAGVSQIQDGQRVKFGKAEAL